MISTKVQTILDLLGKQTYSPEWFKLTKLLGTEPKDTKCGTALVEHSFPANGFSISENNGTYTEVHFFYERQNFESFEDEILKSVELGIERREVHDALGEPCSTRTRGTHKPVPETNSADELRRWELQKVVPVSFFDSYKFDEYAFTLEFDAEDDYLSTVSVCRLADVPKEKLMDAGLYEEAIVYWKNEASQEKNELIYIAHLNLAKCYIKLGDPERADIEFQSALNTSKVMTGGGTPFGITRLKYAEFLLKHDRDRDAFEQLELHLAEHTDKENAQLVDHCEEYAPNVGLTEDEFRRRLSS
jgi:tetratricopeptide (TPR) repeat protein